MVVSLGVTIFRIFMVGSLEFISPVPEYEKPLDLLWLFPQFFCYNTLNVLMFQFSFEIRFSGAKYVMIQF